MTEEKKKTEITYSIGQKTVITVGDFATLIIPSDFTVDQGLQVIGLLNNALIARKEELEKAEEDAKVEKEDAKVE